MAYKSPLGLAGEFIKPGRRPYYYDEKNRATIDAYLSGFNFGDTKYDDERNQATRWLKNQYGLEPDQANDILDAYITRATHYGNNKKNANLRRKAGRFETGNDWNAAQQSAQDLLTKNPDARGVVYGLRYEGEQPQGTSGLKNPFLVYDNDLENIARSLNPGKKQSLFQIDTLFNN